MGGNDLVTCILAIKINLCLWKIVKNKIAESSMEITSVCPVLIGGKTHHRLY